ncbi:MAG: hypothetical protein AMXMBFR64_62490 [Myxococcales bacterium]
MAAGASRGAALLLIALLGACTPDTRIVFGKWQARGGGTTQILPGAVELVLGHYGGDVVGVVRFYSKEMNQDAVWGDLTVPRVAACPCAYIAHGRFDEGPRRLTFTVDVKPPCPPVIDPNPPEDAPALVFTLLLEGDDEMKGSVRYQGSDAPVQALLFRRNTSDSGEIQDADPDKRCEGQQ